MVPPVRESRAPASWSLAPLPSARFCPSQIALLMLSTAQRSAEQAAKWESWTEPHGPVLKALLAGQGTQRKALKGVCAHPHLPAHSVPRSGAGWHILFGQLQAADRAHPWLSRPSGSFHAPYSGRVRQSPQHLGCVWVPRRLETWFRVSLTTTAQSLSSLARVMGYHPPTTCSQGDVNTRFYRYFLNLKRSEMMLRGRQRSLPSPGVGLPKPNPGSH